MSLCARVVFRGKTFELQLDEARERLRSSASVPVAKRFLNLIGNECELSAQQLAKHAVFMDSENNAVDASAPYNFWAGQLVHMHLSQVCSVCQIDAENDVGTEYDGAVFTMFCGHPLHRACFEKMTNKSCPLCRDTQLELQRRQEEEREQQRQQEQRNQVQAAEVSSSLVSYLVPKWSAADSTGYRLTNDRAVAHPDGHGMLILHSEPLVDGHHYRFTVQMDDQVYCAAALLLSKQPSSNRNFGGDFNICKPLHDNFGKRPVHMEVDMRARVAKYRFGDSDAVNTITGLPATVYVACAVKHESAMLRPLSGF